jgi:hypothetical protein
MDQEICLRIHFFPSLILLSTASVKNPHVKFNKEQKDQGRILTGRKRLVLRNFFSLLRCRRFRRSFYFFIYGLGKRNAKVLLNIC